MSILIDDLVKVYSHGNCTYRRSGNKKYIAKTLEFYGFHTIKNRIKDAIRILLGKSKAYHYKEDEEDLWE